MRTPVWCRRRAAELGIFVAEVVGTLLEVNALYRLRQLQAWSASATCTVKSAWRPPAGAPLGRGPELSHREGHLVRRHGKRGHT